MDLFDLDHTLARPLLEGRAFPWDALSQLEDFLWHLGPTLGPDYDQVAEGVWIGRGTKVDLSVSLQAPVIVGRGGEIRPGAYLRSSVLAGDGCVLGHASEFKNSILFDGVQAPHFNYLGDSIAGYRAHFGAGVIASNFKAGGGEISVEWDGQRRATGRTKLGVLAGDGADVGSQTVLNPGVVLGRRSVVYPLVSLRGTVPEDTIVKAADRASWVKRT